MKGKNMRIESVCVYIRQCIINGYTLVFKTQSGIGLKLQTFFVEISFVTEIIHAQTDKSDFIIGKFQTQRSIYTYCIATDQSMHAEKPGVYIYFRQ